jgi:S-adenosylmethionine:tRNA ribosyltransferase-isomerase
MRESVPCRSVRTDELDYDLPPALIAQTPAEPRDAARLLVYRGATGQIEHRAFADVLAELRPDDIVVVNTTRVLPVRVRAVKDTGGAVEVLLLEPRGDGSWEALARPGRRLQDGTVVQAAGGLSITIEGRLDGGRFLVRPRTTGTLEDALRSAGEMPLPPYIHERPDDPERYQTVYAAAPGSAAAPTAGLHFTDALMAAVRARCTVVDVDLRVGLDTFRPVAAADLDEHEMHSEAYAIGADARALVTGARAAGRRVIAVGTTTARVLETIADPAAPDAGRTRLKIQPGYRFGVVDGLVTNFHLPRSTLLALVMALAGVEETRRLYAEAIAERYRFYSFGDAMLLV